MNCLQLIGLNVKWYRYQFGWSQEVFSEKSGFKMAYISTVETGRANLTCKNIDLIAKKLNIKIKQLFDEETAKQALNLPKRFDMYLPEKYYKE